METKSAKQILDELAGTAGILREETILKAIEAYHNQFTHPNEEVSPPKADAKEWLKAKGYESLSCIYKPSWNEDEKRFDYVHDLLTEYASLPDEKVVGEWQLCPKCEGAGKLANMGTTALFVTCDMCNGQMKLVKPLIESGSNTDKMREALMYALEIKDLWSAEQFGTMIEPENIGVTKLALKDMELKIESALTPPNK